MAYPKVDTEAIVRNPIAAIAAALLPVSVFGPPVPRAILLPDVSLFTLLDSLPLLKGPIILLLLLSSLLLLLLLGPLLLLYSAIL